VAVLCNFPSSGPGGLAREVADIVLEDQFPEPLPDSDATEEDEEEEPDPVPLSEDELADLAGYYTQESNDRPVVLREREGHLFMDGRLRLFHEGEWILRPDGEEETVQIVRTPDGSISFTDPNEVRYVRRPSVDRDSVDVEPYIGRYWSEELGVEYEARLEEGRLSFMNRKTGRRNLNPTFLDGFGGGGNSVTFFRDPSGEIAGFTMSSGRVWKVRFRKVE
jgi:hypothetical protein